MTTAPIALLTGAAGGIGSELGRRLLARGYEVLLVERTAELAETARERLGAGVPVACDCSDRAEVAALVARIEGEWADRLELVIANAGMIVPFDVVDQSPGIIDTQLDLMLGGSIQLLAAGARVLAPKGRGHLLATVSMGGILALPGSAVYSAAKSGLRAFLAGLHYELRGRGVRVSGIYPSAVDTPMLYHEATHDGSLLNWVGRVSTAADIADGYERALRTGRLEVYVPWNDSVSTRFGQNFPWIVPRLLPGLNRMGRKGRAKYLRETVSGPRLP